jgi:hypothetical protein
MLQQPLKSNGSHPLDGLPIGVILQARECGLRGQGIGFADDGLKVASLRNVSASSQSW